MKPQLSAGDIDWNPVLAQLDTEKQLPTYRGDLKVALLQHVGLQGNLKAEAAYQLAVEISRLTTCSDPEIIYWFSRLLALLDHE